MSNQNRLSFKKERNGIEPAAFWSPGAEHAPTERIKHVNSVSGEQEGHRQEAPTSIICSQQCLISPFQLFLSFIVPVITFYSLRTCHCLLLGNSPGHSTLWKHVRGFHSSWCCDTAVQSCGSCCLGTLEDLKQKAVAFTSAFSLSISSRDLSSVRLRYFPVVTCLSLNSWPQRMWLPLQLDKHTQKQHVSIRRTGW